MLMSDWACTHSDSAAINGLDLEMGSHSWLIREKLMPLIEKGGISEETINEKVRRIYGPCMEMGFFDRPQQDTSIPTYNPVANRIAYEAACEGMILLKNENILPLKPVKKIAVIGPNANYNLVTDRAHNVNNITYGGGGSSKVHPWYVTSVLQGVTAEFSGAEVAYCEGISNNYTRDVYRNSNFRTKDGKNGLLVPLKNPAALAEAMERLCANPELLVSMGACGRELAAEKFDANVVANGILDDMHVPDLT